MNIIIEDAESLKFFGADGKWTANVTDGKRYAGTNQAFKAAKQEPIGKFNITGYIPETRQFVNLDHGRGTGSEATKAKTPAGVTTAPVTPAAV
jgi:hypothetical protein